MFFRVFVFVYFGLVCRATSFLDLCIDGGESGGQELRGGQELLIFFGLGVVQGRKVFGG